MSYEERKYFIIKNKEHFNVSEVEPGCGVYGYHLDLSLVGTASILQLAEQLALFVDSFYSGKI